MKFPLKSYRFLIFRGNCHENDNLGKSILYISFIFININISIENMFLILYKLFSVFDIVSFLFFSCDGDICTYFPMRPKRRTWYRKPIELVRFVHAKYHATIRPSLSTYSSITYNPSLSISSQLRLHTRQQDRVSRVAELDGGGVPGSPDHQLGCHSVGQKTLRVVGCPSHLSYSVVNRGFAACLPRLQGTSFFSFLK